jgi:hypothetical protein
MSERDDGGSAFPWTTDYEGLGVDQARALGTAVPPKMIAKGMSLRDWFAGNAMNRMQQEFKEERYMVLAEKAYALADAMLKARTK